MASPEPVLIAGGGIAGLALALALARIGRRAHVLEQRETHSEAGAGIQVSPNGVRALDAIGVRVPLEAAAGRPREIRIHQGASGRVLQRLPLGDWIETRHGQPYLVAHRRDLQAALLARARAEPLVAISTGIEVAFFETTADGVRVAGAGGERLEGSALVGADGLFSRVRQQLHAPSAPRFSGRTAARTVLPAEQAGGVLDRGTIGVWLAPGAHVVHYPVSAGREIAIVAIRTEDWRGQGWSAPVDRAPLLASLSMFARPLIDALAAADDWRRWALFDVQPLPRWSIGRVTLAGDAAHPVLPFLAQGGSLALEDAVSLAACLAAAPGDVAQAFLAYEHARRPRAARVARSARRNGQIYHFAGPLAAARNAVLQLAGPERLMAGYDWLYGWQVPAALR